MTGKPLLVVAGPTAVGKTAYALAAGTALGGEIVGADSRQIYRRMDIGTAKPTAVELATVPHHLVDLIPLDRTLTLAEYQRMAYAAIDDIQGRDKLPLLVGGTGQYISAVIEGWGIPEVPPQPALRADLQAYAAAHGDQALHDRLAKHDPTAAARIDHRNVRRVVRALEVCLVTGQPITKLQEKTPPPYRVLTLVLTMDRDALYERADARVDAMMAAGLLGEVRALMPYADAPAMSGLGYAQLVAHLRGEMDLYEAVAAIKHDTHAYIRRQETWFRNKFPDAQTVDVEQVDAAGVIALIEGWLKDGGG